MGDMDPRPTRDDAPPETPVEAGLYTDVPVEEHLVDPAEEPGFAAFLQGVRGALTADPDELTARRHLAAMREEVLAQHRGDRFAVRIAGAAAAAVVAVAATLAGFGALPAPAQEVLSDVAERIGITLPTPAQDAMDRVMIPAKQVPGPETVPGRAGGPTKDELPGRWSGAAERGESLPPGLDEGWTPPGLGGDSTPPGRDPSFTPPGQDVWPEQPGPGGPEGTPRGQQPDRDQPGPAPQTPPDQGGEVPQPPDEPPSPPSEAPSGGPDTDPADPQGPSDEPGRSGDQGTGQGHGSGQGVGQVSGQGQGGGPGN